MQKNKNIAGVWSGHDCSYYVMDGEGNPIVHNELERFNREKEPSGNAVEFLEENFPWVNDIKYLATCWPFHHEKMMYRGQDPSTINSSKLIQAVKDNGGAFFSIGHHHAHAVNAFYSSNLQEARILTIDGGGIEDSKGTTCSLSVWNGNGISVNHIKSFPTQQLNIGGVWTRVTRYVFGLQSGWPTGHQAGTVMAMAALGDGKKYVDDFYRMLSKDFLSASFKPLNQPKGANTGNDPVHPYLNRYKLIAEESDQNRYDLAASLQLATEKYLYEIISKYVLDSSTKNLCLSGGVVLNSVFTGKLWDMFPQLENIYVTPTPHDGGLCIGAAQYVWHDILKNPRKSWEDCFTPYLGRPYFINEISDSLEGKSVIAEVGVTLDRIVDLLEEQYIVSFFSGGSESGRRALGNRSILADPRSIAMKDKVNEKVKHRQWFRPFAPSILRSEVKNWFKKDVDSPYMSFCIELRDDKKDLVPAVNHFDNTARLQTVTENSNPIYFRLLTKWFERTGCPILLNTSFNDREPICETPKHAVECFMGTDIDHLYFADELLLAHKLDN